jgi:hypothetical protein
LFSFFEYSLKSGTLWQLQDLGLSVWLAESFDDLFSELSVRNCSELRGKPAVRAPSIGGRATTKQCQAEHGCGNGC